MEFLTRKEVSEYLKISLSLTDKLIRNQYFNGRIKIGNRVLVSKDKLDEYNSNNMG